MPNLNIKTLGGIRFSCADSELRPATRKASALLVYLALSPRGTRSREHLAELLWGRSAEEQARASLRQTLSSLRKALGEQADLIDTTADTISLRCEGLDIDVQRFRTLANSSDQPDLEQAAVLYDGEFLQGFSVKEAGFEEWLSIVRQQYHELALQVILRLTQQYTMLQEYDRALRYAQSLIALDPLQEQTHLRLMELYLRLGRREQAMRQFDECERMLKHELNVAPGAEIRALHTSIMKQELTAEDSLPGLAQSGARTDHSTRAAAITSVPSIKPGIAVLPFDNLSDDPSQQQFVDAITEDIVSNLAHDLWFNVIAHTSTQQFRDRKSGIAEISAALDAQYIVDGSLRKSGDRIRISVVLIDGSDGKQIWSQRYDRVVADLFELQDQIAISIAAAVIPELNSAEQRSAIRKHPQSLDAWSCCHKAFWHLYKFELPELELAQSLFEQAIDHDPSYSQPYAGLAYSQMMYVWYDSSKKDLLQSAKQNALHAIQLDNRDSYAHFTLGRVLSMLAQYQEAMRELEIAIELNPSFGRAYFGLASVMVYAGRYAQAIEPIDTAIRLSPDDPHLWTFYNIKARALTGLGQYQEAVHWGHKAVQQPSSTFWCDLALISALGYLGHKEEARLAIAELHRRKPGFSCEEYRLYDFVLTEQARELVVEGLRRAGLPRYVGQVPIVDNRPSIAVLPFTNLSGDAAQQYFSDGFSEEVINGLTRFRSFKVIARNSSFVFRDSQQGARDIGRQLAARYLVNGSLRKQGDRLRIAVQLVDSETDSQIWTDQYDGTLDDIFEFQDRVTRAVVGAIEPRIRTLEIDKTQRVINMGAYELYLKALSQVYELTQDSTREALDLLDRAIQLEADFYRARSLSAWCSTLRPSQGWLARDSTEARQAVEHARLALQGEPDNAEVLWQAGYAIWFFSSDRLEGIEFIDRSLVMNANCAQAWVASGWASMFSGNAEKAIAHHACAMELSPMDPIGYRPCVGTAAAFLCLKDFAKAEKWARKALLLGPNYNGCYRVLAAALAYQGRLPEAGEVVRQYLQLVPQESLQFYRMHMPWKDDEYCELHLEGLRRAGIPEESPQLE